MKTLSQGLAGVLMAIFAVMIVLGGLSLALTETGLPLAQGATASPTSPVATPTPGLILTPTVTPTYPPGVTPPTPLPTSTPTLVVTVPANCPPPAGWTPIIVFQGDSLESIALAYGTTVEALRTANCLLVDGLIPGSVLYVPVPIPLPVTIAPPVASATPIPGVVCTPPHGWVIYTVRAGDNLFRIGLAYGITVDQLMSANCLISETIFTGQRLYVPNVSTHTPVPSETPISQHTATATPQAYTITPTPGITLVPSRTPSPTLVPPIPSPTASPTSVSTTTPTGTPTSTPTFTMTAPIATPTATHTLTPEPSETSTPTFELTTTPTAAPLTETPTLPPPTETSTGIP